MSLFDVLNSPDFRSAAGSFAEKARKTASDVTSGAPGGLGGLLGAGALGALLGGFVSKSVLKDAALVGAGAVAWNFYQKWSRSRDAAAPLPEAEPASVPSRAPVQAAPARSAADEDPTAMLMLRSMVYAARADGHIDASERGRILDLVERLCPGRDVTATVNGLMNEPIDPARLAACVRAPEEGEDLYRLSCLIVDVDHFMERSYLDGLASALRIPRDRQLALEGEADQARRRLPG